MRKFVNLLENWRTATCDPNSLEDIQAFAREVGVELEVSENPIQSNIDLYWIKRSPRRVGSGAMVLQALIDYAEKVGFTISLSVTENGAKRDNLIAFYERMGFEMNDFFNSDDPEEDAYMTYYPTSEGVRHQ